LHLRPPSSRVRVRRLVAPGLLVVSLLTCAVSGASLMRSEAVARLDGASAAGALADLAPSAPPADAASTPPATDPAQAPTSAPVTTADGSVPVDPAATAALTTPAASEPQADTAADADADSDAETDTEPAATPPVSSSAPVPAPAPAPVPAPVAAAAAAAAAAADPTVEGQVLALVNVERSAAGCAPVTADPDLAAVARAHSADMRDRGYFSHDAPGGVSPWDRAEAAGISTMRAENIAQGQRDAAAVMAAWMKSPGHRENILDCDLRTLGVGVAQGSGGPWWTQDFGV
jgi:uncharacterized protein YkwD